MTQNNPPKLPGEDALVEEMAKAMREEGWKRTKKIPLKLPSGEITMIEETQISHDLKDLAKAALATVKPLLVAKDAEIAKLKTAIDLLAEHIGPDVWEGLRAQIVARDERIAELERMVEDIVDAVSADARHETIDLCAKVSAIISRDILTSNPKDTSHG